MLENLLQGDSGGPLVCKHTGDPREGELGILAGLTSGGDFSTGDGTFFTRVSSYHTFILSKRSSCNRVQMFNWLFLVTNSIFLLF